ncbi:hypothetical protein L9F63_022425 [Diploptera punctata]|uniref:folate gamma-glutamyl hydrolase n=1 Tax=Diploptera punctata TaxID=6984 RepID=A0AAD7ZM80_DIPPU|nr:hypothetical protein L9F63_022425 [Diploptera punctata]
MKITFVPVFLCVLCFHSCVITALNNRPIIGVVAQEMYNRPNYSYIAASYVKFVEGSGARVVPVLINQDDEYYEYIVKHVNGILLPGGGTYFNVTGGFADAGVKLYQLALEMNKKGDYFPIWGTCLGFELLTYAAADRVEHRLRCEHYNEAVPLDFLEDATTSRMFGNISWDLMKILMNEDVTANFHHFCLTKKNMTELGLAEDWRFMTFNHDKNDLEYISTLEHKHYPFYGVQFHPEKNNYEWKEGKNHPHNANGVRTSQYFANFFVNEARKNHHEFPSEEEEKKYLIYNHPAINTSKQSFFMQIYVFEQ